MPRNASYDAFLRAHQERYDDFLTKFNRFIVVITRNNEASKLEAAEALAQSLDLLKKTLSEQDRPPWITQLEGPLITLLSAKQQGHVENLIKLIVTIYNQIIRQRWEFSSGDEPPSLDFDAVYERRYNESRIPDLFEELVRKLEEIVQSDQIDSRKAISALEKLIATIKRNVRGSYFSIVNTWIFIRKFSSHAFWNAAEEIPSLKVVVKSIKDTLTDMQEEFDKLEAGITRELDDATSKDLLSRSAKVF